MCALQIAMNDDHCRKFLARSSDSQAQQTHPLRNRERVAQPTILQKRNPFPIGRHQIESGWKERKKVTYSQKRKEQNSNRNRNRKKSHTQTHPEAEETTQQINTITTQFRQKNKQTKSTEKEKGIEGRSIGGGGVVVVLFHIVM